MGDEEVNEVIEVLKSGWLAPGEYNKMFESDFAKLVGAKHAITMNSCASALEIALKANNIKGEVIIPSFTFVASYIIFSPIIFKVFFPQYLDSVAYSQVYSLSLLFFPAVFLVRVLVAHARKIELYWLRIVIPMLKIALLLILLPLLGIWGGIISLLSAELINAIMLLYFFKKMPVDWISGYY
ncbi:MAG: DegT/DnrJ/EryC1/StrS family aminotransferase [Patescibacteria group bacterium]